MTAHLRRRFRLNFANQHNESHLFIFIFQHVCLGLLGLFSYVFIFCSDLVSSFFVFVETARASCCAALGLIEPKDQPPAATALHSSDSPTRPHSITPLRCSITHSTKTRAAVLPTLRSRATPSIRSDPPRLGATSHAASGAAAPSKLHTRQPCRSPTRRHCTRTREG